MTKYYLQKPNFKKLQKESITGVDMHFHTEYSMDGISRVDNALRKAKNLGIGFAVTDHNEIKGVIKAEKLKKNQFFVPGIEITSKIGSHILVYSTHASNLIDFYDKNIKPLRKINPFFIQKTFAELLDLAKSNGFFVGVPHPFGAGITGVKNSGEKFNVKKVDFIEGINGACLRKMNIKAIDWASQANKGMSAGTDAHNTSEMGKILCISDSSSIENFLKGIKSSKNVICGKEENLFPEAIDMLERYIKEGEKQGMKKELLNYKTRFGTEWPYFKKKFEKMGSHFHHYYMHHHYSTKKEGERPIKEHHLKWLKEHKHFSHLLKHFS
ncbi:MAG: PHP domain-containing protein [Nanoarchaeota archaeon]|nr:PHP domain-containing protein [Nanoarchaeota archaeon]MBU1704269.1 PHP domain-containing protein [Nanoarchaeota archaeon]